jgi:two-component system, chemotaxis family, sensor kinase Cph1
MSTHVTAEQLKLGDHAAFFFRTNEERLSWAVPYIASGLERNERCLYIADENTVFDIFCRLKDFGVDVRSAQRRGALSVLTKRETYLRHGMFEPAKMVGDLHNEVKYSLEHGFTGFRASGEMSWALDLPSALGRLIEYEETLQQRWPTEFGALCQYNESLFTPEIVQRMIDIHSVIVRRDKIVRQEAKGLAREIGAVSDTLN